MSQPKSRPVVIAMSVLAGSQFLFGGITAINIPTLNPGFSTTLLTIGAFGTLITAAAQTGFQFYLQNIVVPEKDVLAYVGSDGQTVVRPGAVEVVPVEEATDVLAPAADVEGQQGP